MIGYFILLGYSILFIISFNKNNSETLTLNLLSITFPWVLYFSLIYIFQIKFYSLNINFFIFIFFLSLLSYIACITGYNSAKNEIFKTNKNFENFEKYYIFFISLGIIGALVTVYERFDNFSLFLSTTNPEELYKLRYSTNIKDVGLRIESNIEYLKILYPFSFISIVPVGGSFKIKTLRYVCLTLFVLGALMVAGRFNFLFAVIALGIFTYNNKKIFNLRNLSIILIFFYFLSLSFTLRSSNFDTLYFYKNLAGISDINFLGLKNLDSVFFTPIYNLITYYVQSANHLTSFLIDYDLRKLAFGGYQFDIVFGIINKVLGTSLVTKRELAFNDYSVGLFSTYIRDVLADFGYIGCIVFSTSIGYLLGNYSAKQNLHWIYRVIYYFLIIQFALAPLLLIYSDFILLLNIYLFAFLYFKKKNN